MSLGCAYALHDIGLAGDPASPVHRLDPRAKLIGLTAVTVVAVSAPLRAWPALAACGLALALVAAAARVGVATIASRARVVLPLIALVAVFAPFAEDGAQTFAAVGLKATCGAVSAVLLGATTSFPDLLHALERLRAPRVLVLIAAFMYRYLFVIAGEAHRMRAALAARGYRPRHALQVAALGRVVTALFLRTYDRGERVYLAMLARGYRGSMPRLRARAFGRRDAAFVAALATPLLAVRVLAEVAA